MQRPSFRLQVRPHQTYGAPYYVSIKTLLQTAIFFVCIDLCVVISFDFFSFFLFIFLFVFLFVFFFLFPFFVFFFVFLFSFFFLFFFIIIFIFSFYLFQRGRLGEGGSIDGLCMEMPNSWVVDFTQYLDSIKLTIASKLLLRSYGPNLVHAKAPI